MTKTIKTKAEAGKNGGSAAASSHAKELHAEVKEPSGVLAEPTHEEIAVRAFELFLARGGVHGSAVDDWLAAEADLRAERGVKGAGPSSAQLRSAMPERGRGSARR